MMAASNIDRFNEVAGIIFAHLYQSFPVPTRITPSLIGIDISNFTVLDRVKEVNYGGFDDLPEEKQNEVLFMAHTVCWLARAGFIRHDGSGRHSFFDATLTLEGLELLKATPVSLGPSLGDQLLDAAKSGVTAKIKEISSELISKAVTLGIKAATDFVAS